MPGPQIAIEDDPTPLVLGLATDVSHRLDDRDFAARTSELLGVAAVRVGSGPEAATIELGDPVSIRHGVVGPQVTVTVDSRCRWDGGPIAGADDHPALARWVTDLTSPPPGPWREAAARLWDELGSAPGAPGALLVVELESGEELRFGEGDRAYEIRGPEEALIALLEGRTSLLEEAASGAVLIRGTFPEISVVTGACDRIRMGWEPGDA